MCTGYGTIKSHCIGKALYSLIFVAQTKLRSLSLSTIPFRIFSINFDLNLSYLQPKLKSSPFGPIDIASVWLGGLCDEGLRGFEPRTKRHFCYPVLRRYTSANSPYFKRLFSFLHLASLFPIFEKSKAEVKSASRGNKKVLQFLFQF